MRAGDLGDVAGAVAPMALRIEGCVDGRNQSVPDAELQRIFLPATRAYKSQPERFTIKSALNQDSAAWILGALKQ